jgi:hypothetical protein
MELCNGVKNEEYKTTYKNLKRLIVYKKLHQTLMFHGEGIK